MSGSRGKFIFFALVLAVAFGPTSAAVAGVDNKVTLQLRLELRKTYILSMITSQKITQSIAGQDYLTTQMIGYGCTLKALQIYDNGFATVEYTYKSIYFKQEGPAGSFEYDSANPPEVIPPAAQAYAALIGCSFRARLDSTSKVLELQGIGDMLGQMLRNLNLPPGQATEQARQILKSQYSDEAFKESLSDLFYGYPKTPLAVGYSWEKESRVSTVFPMRIRNVFTLTGRNGGVSTLQVEATAVLDKDAAKPGTGGLNFTSLSGFADGTIDISEATGLPLKSLTQQSLTGTIEIATGPQAGSWPISIEATTMMETR